MDVSSDSTGGRADGPFGALALTATVVECETSSARTVASAAARLAGRGPVLTLRRCEGGLRSLR